MKIKGLRRENQKKIPKFKDEGYKPKQKTKKHRTRKQLEEMENG